MPVTVTARAVSAYGAVRCPSCGHFLPARPEPEITCKSCWVTWRVEL